MKDYKFTLPTSLDKIDVDNDNIDVLVTLSDEKTYVLVVATLLNIHSLMKKNGKTFLEAGAPFAIVDKLTFSNIEKVVDSFCAEDGYWLKYYHNAGEWSFHSNT